LEEGGKGKGLKRRKMNGKERKTHVVHLVREQVAAETDLDGGLKLVACEGEKGIEENGSMMKIMGKRETGTNRSKSTA
jgi:hypothetical protein